MDTMPTPRLWVPLGCHGASKAAQHGMRAGHRAARSAARFNREAKSSGGTCAEASRATRHEIACAWAHESADFALGHSSSSAKTRTIALLLSFLHSSRFGFLGPSANRSQHLPRDFIRHFQIGQIWKTN